MPPVPTASAMSQPRRPRRTPAIRGQSLVEFALVLPILLLLLLTAIDFGRIYLGWVNLTQMTRIAASFAADHASAWGTPPDTVVQDRYVQKMENDARAINCELPPSDAFPPPVFAGGTGLGAHVSVGISCNFTILTPIISDILGGDILVTAETTYPVMEGAVATVPGGGGPITPPPEADFMGLPRSGWAPLDVTFTDTSLHGPGSWTWDFSVGASATGVATGDASPGTALSQGPHTVTYDCVGDPGDVCRFGVVLTVQNSGGVDSISRSDYITVTVPPATGPIAEFTGTPLAGTEPLAVDFDFVDLRGGTITYTTYAWTFGDGGTGTGPTPSHTYADEGVYDVTLTVTDSTGATNTLTKTAYITVAHRTCRVPDFAGTKKNNAQATWAAAGFTTTVLFGSGNGNWTIRTQSLVGGTVDPQPNGCASTITVLP